MEKNQIPLLKEFLYCFVKYHLLLEAICTRLRRLYHLDYLRIGAAIFTTASKSCNGFLCHFFSLLYLLNLAVKSITLKDGVILL